MMRELEFLDDELPHEDIKKKKFEATVFDSTLLYQTPVFSKSRLKSKFKISFYGSKSKF